VPNAELVHAKIENFAEFDAHHPNFKRRRICMQFVLDPRTPVDALDKIPDIARQACEAKGAEGIELNVIAFNNIVEYGLKYDFRFFAPGVMTECRKQRQIVVHAFLRGLAEEGMSLATPTSSLARAVEGSKIGP
jgi:hypothetical protein